LGASDEQRERFLDGHYLELRPATDDTPFFFNLYKWKSLIVPNPDDSHTTPSTGQRMLLVMLVQSVLIAALVTLGPLYWLRPRANARSTTPRSGCRGRR